jgi:hypothetical protein
VQVFSNEVKKWQQFEYPKELSRLKNIFDWRAYPEEKKSAVVRLHRRRV